MLSYLNRKSQIANRKSGQGLLLAVLVMLLVALMGAAFVGVISFNLAQSARHEDVVKADQMAKAGIEYADQQLTNSPQGADWRPQDSLGDISLANASTRAATSGYYDEIETARGWADGTYIKFPDPNNPSLGSLGNPDFGGGRFLLKVEYPGGPANSPTAGSIKITSVGRSTNNPAVFKVDVAYKPVTLANNLLFVTHKKDDNGNVDTTKTAVLGTAPQLSFDAETMLKTAVTANNTDTIKVNNKGAFSSADEGVANLLIIGDGANRETATIVTGGFSPASDDGFTIQLTAKLQNNHPVNSPVHRSDTYVSGSDTVNTILNGPLFVNGNLQWFGNTILNLTSSRRDMIQIAGGYVPDPNNPGKPKQGYTGFQSDDPTTGGNSRSLTINVDGNPASITGSDAGYSDKFTDVTANGSPVYMDGTGRLNNNRAYSDRWVTPITPPVFVTGDVSTNNVKWIRFLDMTKYSNNTLLTAGSAVTKGQTGFGTGIYINNYNYSTNQGDLQYGPPTYTTAASRLAKTVADWIRSDRPPSSDADSGWVNDQEYVPKGVEILLRSDDLAADGTTQGNYTAHPYNNAPHISGYPVIWMRMSDAAYAAGQRWYKIDGSTITQQLVSFDYPDNGVLLVEGNIRIRGNLPLSYLKVDGTTVIPRSFNLTVVSGGTIYIEGSILTPKDSNPSVSATNNTHIALLAKDHICVNTTQFHHRGINGASPGPTAASTYPASTDGNDSKWIISNAGNDDLARNVTFSAVPSVTPKLTVRYGGVFKLNYRGTNATATIQVSGANPDLTGTAGTDSFGPQNLKSASSPNVKNLDDTTPDGLKNWVNTNNGWNAAQVASGFTTSQSKDLALLGNAIDVRYWYFWLPMTTKLDLTVGGTTVKDESGGNLTSPVFTNTFPKRYAIFTLPAVPSVGVETPVLFDRQTGSGDDFRLGRFKVEQVDASGNVLQQGMDITVSALMYAQEGTFFIIPGGYFDDSTKTTSGSTDGAVRFRRYNYHIKIHGAVTQSYTADEGQTDAYILNSTQWTDKWSYPLFNGTSYTWNGIEYQYDPDLRAVTTSGSLPVPKLPLAPGLLYVG